jgi:ligand-binding sensor domain-containing protein
MKYLYILLIIKLFKTIAAGQYSISNIDMSNSPITANEIFTVKFFNNAMWIGTWLNGLCHITDNKWTILRSDSIKTTGNNIIDIHKDKKGNIWLVDYAFFSGASVVRYNGISWEVLTPFNEPNTQVTGISEDKNGNLWFQTYGAGIYFYNLNKQIWTHLTLNNSGLFNYSIRCIAIDNDNKKWIGHYDGGFDIFNDTTWTNHFGDIELSVETIAFGDSNLVWVGTSYNGIILLDSATTYLDTHNSPLPSNSIKVIKIDSKGRVWIGTEKGLIIKDGNNWITFKDSLLLNTEIRDITFENDSSIWLSSWGKGLIHLVPNQTTKINQVLANELLLFPNPFIDGINISTLGKNTVNQIDILTIDGNLIISKTLGENHFIDLIELPSGIYFAKIYFDNVYCIKKLIKNSGL